MIQGFSYYFCMMMEGSGSRSGSIPVTSGSGSGRPKNTWIRWILIRIRIRNSERINRQNTISRNWPIDWNLSNPSPPCHFTLPRKITTVYRFLIIVVFYLNILFTVAAGCYQPPNHKPVQNLDAEPKSGGGGGVGQPKMCIPPGYAPALAIWLHQRHISWFLLSLGFESQ